ncbi:MAG: polyphosphate polymerase domain-containing protein [Clostridiales bacterium]|nr:polyphosphate polymerase domain-containing protein [Clostridiales bacterium]
MSYQAVFKRYEIKFIINKTQAENLQNMMSPYMRTDKHGNSNICNLYFDTPDFLLIRRSIEKPIYKEKLRLRSYGKVSLDKEVFPELKKKYNGIVYKRRLEMPENKAMACLLGKLPFPDTQIGREIAYCFKRYQNLAPRVFLSCEREAFYAKRSSDFRMTFDKNILWRDYDLSLCSGIYGASILDEDQILLEVKTSSAIPLWLTKWLSENKIYKTSFSKYGNAYIKMGKRKGENKYV